MSQYRHKYDHFVVEARQWTGMEVCADIEDWVGFENWINRNRGEHQKVNYFGRLIVINDYDDKRLAAEPGDWIIKHHSGLYPVPSYAFLKMFEEVVNAEAR